MKDPLDRFSGHARAYHQFRPVYPRFLYEEILRITAGRNLCWDCGTGNGQVAMALARDFSEVKATDISCEQLQEAPTSPRVIYSVGRAENSLFPDNFFDLITVAQAIHWFDIPLFYEEVFRVAKSDATLAVWGYGLLRIRPEIDVLISRLYKELAPFWDPQRSHIEQEYAHIDFPFPDAGISQNILMEQHMSLEGLVGYLNSWSAVQKSIRKGFGNPLDKLLPEFQKKVDINSGVTVKFPIFIKAGHIYK